MLVKEFFAQATIECFHKSILLRLARRDVAPLDAGVLAPSKDRVAGQFGAVIADHPARQPATLGDGGQLQDKRSTFARFPYFCRCKITITWRSGKIPKCRHLWLTRQKAMS